MSQTVIVHLLNEDPIMAELEKLPNPGDQFVILISPRRRDGKSLPYLEREAVSCLFPWHRISFIEVLPGEAEMAEVVKFFRE